MCVTDVTHSPYPNKFVDKYKLICKKVNKM